MTRRPARLPAVLAAATALAALGAAAPPAGAAPVPLPPGVTARAAIVVEGSSGEVVTARAATRPRPIASATKLMTTLLALENIALTDRLTAPRYRAGPAETRINLRAGERMRVSDLVRALLLPSANDAAVTLAEGVSGSRSAFVAEMNRRARELGLRSTRFANPIGLDAPGNRSSALDLARLVLHLRAHPFFRRTVDLPRTTLRSGDRVRTVVNRNPLVRSVPWVDGVKTGHTLGAGYVLVGSGTRRGVSVVSVVLGEPSEAARARDTLRLLRFGIAQYRRLLPVRRDRVVGRVPIRYRDESVDILPAETVPVTVRRGRRPAVRIHLPDEVDGPLARGGRVGTAIVSYRGREVARVSLVAARDVPAAGVITRFVDMLWGPLTLALLAAIFAGGMGWVLVRRRLARRTARGAGIETA